MVSLLAADVHFKRSQRALLVAWHVRLSQYYENEANEQKLTSDQAMTVTKSECGSGSGSEKENSRVSVSR